ncbi:hypothetical protein [Pontibacter beigongshangensis]|uniref:hypothetical protein n=1 Tax=Pontibacter beigongshangensis TaxID=2574733 RepID=UPI001650BDBF|nr:hypothetical protein [Pontibacter beigongshangensis]
MNRNNSDYDQNRGHQAHSSFQTRRSEQYRHPEQHHKGYPQPHERFEDYGISAQGGYGNRGNFGDYDYQDDDMAGYRNESNQDVYGTYSTSRNYGNMGSYGGAQGFGSSRGGYASQRRPSEDSGSAFDSGMSSPNWQHDYNRGSRGYQSDLNYNSSSGYRNPGREETRGWLSDDRGSRWGSNRLSSGQDPYGDNMSDRFQGGRHGSSNYDRSDDQFYGSDRDNEERDGYYMGSSYSRISRGDYGSNDGNYGSLRKSDEEREFRPYGLSGYYSGGYGY